MSMMDQIRGFISTLDMFPEQIVFSYRKKKEYSTPCGGFASLIVLSVLLIYFFYLLVIMTRKESPTLVTTMISNSDPLNIYIVPDVTYSNVSQVKFDLAPSVSNNSFYFYISVALIDGNGIIMIPDESYFSLLIFQEKSKDKVVSQVPIKPIFCPKFDTLKEQYKLNNLSYSFCVNSPYNLKGDEYSDYSKLSFVLKKCVGNSPTGKKCQSASAINSLIDQLKFNFFYSTALIDPTNTKNPLYSAFFTQYWDLLSVAKKYSKLKVTIDVLKSYENYLPIFFTYEQPRLYYSLKVLENDDFVIPLDSSNIAFRLDIVPATDYVVTQRSYSGIFIAVASVGGITNIIISIGFYFVFYFADFRKEESLCNDLYNIIDPNEDEKIKIQFDDFLRKHYNRLVKRNIKNIREDIKKDLKDEMDMKEKEKLEKKSTSVYKIDTPINDDMINDDELEEQNSQDIDSSVDSKKNNGKAKNVSKKKKVLPRKLKGSFKNKRKIKLKKYLTKLMMEKVRSRSISGIDSEENDLSSVKMSQNILSEQSKNRSNEKEINSKDKIQDNEVNDEEEKLDEFAPNKIKIENEGSEKNDVKVQEEGSNNENDKLQNNKIKNEKTEKKKNIFGKQKKKYQEENVMNTKKDSPNHEQFQIIDNPDQATKFQSSDYMKKMKNFEDELKDFDATLDFSSESCHDSEDEDDLDPFEKYMNLEIYDKIFGMKEEERNEKIKEILKDRYYKNKITKKNKTLGGSKNKSSKLASQIKKALKLGITSMFMKEFDDKKKHQEKLDLFDLVFESKSRNETEYLKNVILFNSVKYENTKGIHFTFIEILKLVFCSYCMKRNYNAYTALKEEMLKSNLSRSLVKQMDIETSQSIRLLNKYRVMRISRNLLTKDIDIMTVLSSVVDFKKLKKVYFDKEQSILFESVSKPIIKEDDILDSEKFENEMEEIKPSRNMLSKLKNIKFGKLFKFKKNDIERRKRISRNIEKYKLLLDELKKNPLNLDQEKILQNIGIDVETIIKFNKYIETSKIKDSEEYKKIQKDDEKIQEKHRFEKEYNDNFLKPKKDD